MCLQNSIAPDEGRERPRSTMARGTTGAGARLEPSAPLPYNRGVRVLVARIRLRYRYPLILLGRMVATDFKLRYQASILGYLWTILRPLAIFTILYVVFVQFLRLGKDVPFYAVYLLLGIVVWGFFAEVTSQSLLSLVARADLMRKMNFPRYVVVLSVGVAVLISFLLNVVVVVFFMVLLRVPARIDLLWLPLLFVELTALSLAVALFLSALYVRFRDLNYIWEVLLQAAFYATPVIYPLSMVPARYARVLVLNPMTQIIQDARYVMVTDQTVTITQLYGSPWVRVVPVVITLALSVGSVIYFRRRSPYFAEVA
jgi:ABC-2 type transport system permease protein